MKRDMDLIRNILLFMEANEKPSPTDDDWLNFDCPDDTFHYHLGLLHQAGYINAIDADDEYVATGITWDGHEFLDTVRNESVWKSAVAKATAAVGGASVAILGELAKTEIKRRLNLPS